MGPRDWTYILLANLSFEENPSRGDGYLSFLIYYYFLNNVYIGLVGFSLFPGHIPEKAAQHL